MSITTGGPGRGPDVLLLLLVLASCLWPEPPLRLLLFRVTVNPAAKLYWAANKGTPGGGSVRDFEIQNVLEQVRAHVYMQASVSTCIHLFTGHCKKHQTTAISLSISSTVHTSK